MNEKRLSGDDDFRCPPPLVGLQNPPHLPPPPFPSRVRGGEHSLPPGSHAAFRLLSPSLLLHRLPRRHPPCPTPPLKTRPSPGVERIPHFAPLSEIVRRRPQCVHRGLRFIRRIPYAARSCTRDEWRNFKATGGENLYGVLRRICAFPSYSFEATKCVAKIIFFMRL